MHNAYYQSNGIEAIDVIDAYELSFALGNVVKYVLRAGRKTSDSLTDLRKALDYLEHEIELREKNASEHADLIGLKQLQKFESES